MTDASASHPSSTTRTRHTWADVIFDAFYSGAIGGSIVALFFLIVDLVRAEPLFTPTLMGSVLFTGAKASAVTGVNVGLVAAYTVVHLLAFGALGALAALTVHAVELRSAHPALILALLFLIVEGAFALGAGIFMPGVIARVGAVWIAIANLLAAVGMAVFFVVSHEPLAWRHLKETVRI